MSGGDLTFEQKVANIEASREGQARADLNAQQARQVGASCAWCGQRGGTVTSEEEVNDYLRRGFYLCNSAPGSLQIHHPGISLPPYVGGGLHATIVGELADRLTPIHDKGNYEARLKRASSETPSDG